MLKEIVKELLMSNPIIGIHHHQGSFSDRWIEYCEMNNIMYKIVDAYSSSLIDDCRGLDAFLCHWSNGDFVSWLVSKQIVTALEFTGIYTFPNLNTFWHYDDKIAQKYLLEAIAAPVPNTWIFYDHDRATNWVLEDAEYPIVFKLRRGAASSNVKLIQNKQEALKFCNQAFRKGFISTPSYFYDFKKKIRKQYSIDKLFEKFKNAPKNFHKSLTSRKQFNREKGYLYFQEFLPNNLYDTRVTIIGERAFAVKRSNRPNDFRASASGLLNYENIDLELIKIAFNVVKKAKLQSAGLDILYKDKKPVISEVSFGFPAYMVYDSPGYWDPNLSWHEGHIRPQDAIIEDLIAKFKKDHG